MTQDKFEVINKKKRKAKILSYCGFSFGIIAFTAVGITGIVLGMKLREGKNQLETKKTNQWLDDQKKTSAVNAQYKK